MVHKICPTCKASIWFDAPHTCLPAWDCVIATNELIGFGYGIQPAPADLAHLTRLIYAPTPGDAAQQYAKHFDEKESLHLGQNESTLWVHVRLAHDPDAKPQLFAVACVLEPQYEASEPDERQMRWYEQACRVQCDQDSCRNWALPSGLFCAEHQRQETALPSDDRDTSMLADRPLNREPDGNVIYA